MVHIKDPKSTENDAYAFIRDELERLGWNIKNPARDDDGEVYKQNEVLNNIELKKQLERDMPEAVIKINNSIFWVIESKRYPFELEKALNEAKFQYAKKINKSNHVQCLFVSGVAGNDSDGFNVSNQFLHNGKWKKIILNEHEKTSLLSRNEINKILNKNSPIIRDNPEFSEEQYLNAAERINEILHLAAINKSKRARFIAAMVLSFAAKTEPNLNKNTKSLVKEINDNIEQVLSKKGKEDFHHFISLQLPPNQDNHDKYRNAIIQTYRELKRLDIKSAMNSGNDVLGNFYEAFLKYGNGAKEIGIVLTPRHITSFAVEVLDINNKDLIYDPTCGTGGFLVSSFDYIKENYNENQIEGFKKNRIFGIEQEDDVVALALVNMIFRGDGRNNIHEGNCFQKGLVEDINGMEKTAKIISNSKKEENSGPVTKVLMNPPFALQKGDEKEYHFINHALKQMEDGGLLFSIFPSTKMFKGGGSKKWRKQMLKNNTLKAVIKLPEDLFYPIGVHASAIIIQKGRAHQKRDDIFWGYLTDGYVKVKGVMRKRKEGNISLIRDVCKDFLNNSKNIKKSEPKNYSIKPMEWDNDIECAPEYYLEEQPHTKEEILNEMERLFVNLFNHLSNYPYINKMDSDINIDNHYNIEPNSELDEIFSMMNAKSGNIKEQEKGQIPFVTSTTINNGVEMYINPDEDPDSHVFENKSITVSSFGHAYIQLPPFVGRSHGAIIVLEDTKNLSLIQLLYYAAQINLQGWRFSYGRWVTQKRLLKLNINDINNFKLPAFSKLISSVKKRINAVQNILDVNLV